jgi:hypothetical protein
VVVGRSGVLVLVLVRVDVLGRERVGVLGREMQPQRKA